MTTTPDWADEKAGYIAKQQGYADDTDLMEAIATALRAERAADLARYKRLAEQYWREIGHLRLLASQKTHDGSAYDTYEEYFPDIRVEREATDALRAELGIDKEPTNG